MHRDTDDYESEIRRRRRQRLHDTTPPQGIVPELGWYFPRPNEIPTGTVQAMVDHASFEGALP